MYRGKSWFFAIDPRMRNDSQTGPDLNRPHTNLPNQPTQIAILRSGLNFKIESHGMSFRGFRLFQKNCFAAKPNN
jgi:hypothetical protein